MNGFQPDREELAWAAGFFDGEGTIYCSGGERLGQLRVYVPQIEVTTLRRFKAAIGGLGSIYGPWQRHRFGRPCQPIYTFQIGSSAGAISMIAMLWGFLSAPKRKQIHKAVAAFRAHRTNVRAVVGRYAKSRRWYSQEELLERIRRASGHDDERRLSRQAVFRRYFGSFVEAKRQAQLA